MLGCPFGRGSRCVLTGHCSLAGVLGGALQDFLAHLDGFSLADLLPGNDLPLKVGQRMKLERRRAK